MFFYLYIPLKLNHPEEKPMRPIFLKLGAALALSIAGFLISRLRFRLLRSPHSRSRLVPEAGVGGKGLKDELRILKNEDSLAKIVNDTSTTTTTTRRTTFSSKSSADGGGLFIPEFSNLAFKELETTCKDLKATGSETQKRLDSKEELSLEQEIANLKKLVGFLQERERSLELQLFEYYGLQEQENTARELESQLKINNIEAKLLTLEFQSSQGENQRLQLDYSKAIDELENTRNIVKSLKRKLKIDAEQAKEKIIALQQRIAVLQSGVNMDAQYEADLERELEKFKKFENEVINLRILNSTLEQKNFELRQKLETSIISAEAKALEEAKHLKEMNNKLLKEIEQHQSNHCADVEELVYLKWVNACLRYELRNYQPPAGKLIARDLSKTLSPRSEEKAKQLILEYADTVKGSSQMNFDTGGYSSSSQASVAEYEETSSVDASTRRHSSRKTFFSKLKKIILRKDAHDGRPPSADTTSNYSNYDRRVSLSIDDEIGRCSEGSFSSSTAGESLLSEKGVRSKNKGIARTSSLDILTMKGMSFEEQRENKGGPYSCSQSIESTELLSNATKNDVRDKIKLKTFSKTLKKSEGIEKTIRRSSSFSN